MCEKLRHLLAVIGLILCCLLPRAYAGTLAKADIERMVDYFYVVGEILPDLPVYPLFVKEAAQPDAKPELRAYVFESVDFAPARGYSGKPINLLIIMDLSGTFLKIRLLDHREPLFLDAAGTLKLERFAAQYKGLSPRHTVEIGPYNDPGLRDEQVAHVKGVQQGTISVKAINRAILHAAAAVATARLKSVAEDSSAAHSSAVMSKETKDAKELKEPKDLKETKEAKDTKDPRPVLAADDSKAAMTARPAAETHEGRIAAAEKKNDLTIPAPSLAMSGPTSEARAEPATAADKRVSAMPSAADGALAQAAEESNSPPGPTTRSDSNAGRGASSSEMQDWIDAWQSSSQHVLILLCGLTVLSIGLIAQRRLSASPRRLRSLRTVFLLFTLGFIGWTAQGQLTIVNLTAALESLTSGGDLGFLMNDPMTVILWLFVGVTLLVWGRGSFCGWLCPFGALQELISLVAQAIGHKQRRLRAALDARLKKLKYLILALLLASLYLSPPLAELLVEIEPFKTAISLYFVRDWPYVAWAVFCVLLSVLVYRGYCRYLCPLGAALASMRFLRVWSWIPRRQECGTPCQTCRHRCEYQAISPAGQIHYHECFQCLDCVSIYQDAQRCFPLIQMKKKSTV